MQKLGLFPKIVADRVAEFLKLYDILSVMKDLGSSQENEMLQLKEQHPLKELKIDTGDEATSRLVAFLDTSVSGLPVSPNNSNIEIEWNASGIFQL